MKLIPSIFKQVRSEQIPWLENSIVFLHRSINGKEEDTDMEEGYLWWLSFLSRHINKYIDDNHINGPNEIYHKHILSIFRILAYRYCNWTNPLPTVSKECISCKDRDRCKAKPSKQYEDIVFTYKRVEGFLKNKGD